jgi:hypothetical protein
MFHEFILKEGRNKTTWRPRERFNQLKSQGNGHVKFVSCQIINTGKGKVVPVL